MEASPVRFTTMGASVSSNIHDHKTAVRETTTRTGRRASTWPSFRRGRVHAGVAPPPCPPHASVQPRISGK